MTSRRNFRPGCGAVYHKLQETRCASAEEVRWQHSLAYPRLGLLDSWTSAGTSWLLGVRVMHFYLTVPAAVDSDCLGVYFRGTA